MSWACPFDLIQYMSVVLTLTWQSLFELPDVFFAEGCRGEPMKMQISVLPLYINVFSYLVDVKSAVTIQFERTAKRWSFSKRRVNDTVFNNFAQDKGE